MDNQNANYGGFPQDPDQGSSPNPPQDPNQTVIMPDNFENLRTQSMVETARDVSEKELAEQEARNAEMIRQQKIAELHRKEGIALRDIIFIIIGVGIAVAIVWVVINIIIAAQAPAGETPDAPVEDPTKYSTIEGYQCKTSDCTKMADFPDGRSIIRDTKFYIYNPETKETKLTTIEQQVYYSMEPFVWNKRNLVVLKPESGAFGLYDADGNRQVADFAYDKFYTSINDPVYDNMHQVEQNYIVAHASGSYRLIDTVLGDEILSGPNGIYVYKNIIIGYESAGKRYIYFSNGGDPFLKTNSGDELFYAENMIIYLKKDKNAFEYYATETQSVTTKSKTYTTVAGKKLTVSGFTEKQKALYTTLNKTKAKERRSYILSKPKVFYRIPLELKY